MGQVWIDKESEILHQFLELPLQSVHTEEPGVADLDVPSAPQASLGDTKRKANER